MDQESFNYSAPSRKKAIVTVAHGEGAQEQLSIVLPSWQTYAQWHGWDLFLERGALADGEAKARKVAVVEEALNKGYDEVLWLDTDVIILDSSYDIAGSVPTWASFAARLEQNVLRTNPNTGVWFFRNTPLTHQLLKAYDETTLEKDYIWCDQAIFMKLLGYELHPYPHGIRMAKPTAFLEGFYPLSLEWNAIFQEDETWGKVRFRHVTRGYENRLTYLRELASKLETDGRLL